MVNTKLYSPDIECEACSRAISKALGTNPGISDIRIEVSEKKITLEHKPEVTRAEIIKALDKAGFSVSE